MENFGEQFCAYCGKRIGIKNKFCPYCGINVIKSSSEGTKLKNAPYKEIFFGLGGFIYLVILAMISIILWNSMKLVVPIILWIMLSGGLFYLGSGIRYLGNWMTGFRLDNSIGSVFWKN